MSVLIVYTTIEGQTGKIAQFANDVAAQTAADVAIVDAKDETQTISFDGVDHVILAAPVHERRHPKSFEAFILAALKDLEARKTMLLSVSLSAAFPDGLEEAGEYLREMEMRTQFTPTVEVLVAGALRANRYDYYATQVLKHVVLRGKDFNPSDTQHEFTDWDALETQIKEFLAL